MENTIGLSIIVCTYNRAYIIEECLHSIVKYISTDIQYEIIIVDNNSTDNTESVIANFSKTIHHTRYIKEPTLGLSNARNKGCEVALYDYLCYLDDDAKVTNNYFSELLKMINTPSQFACFGGPYIAWFPFGKPKWLPSYFGNKPIIQKQAGVLQIDKGLLTGGNFIIRKDILKQIGGFSPKLGMNGQKIAYGEEDHIQQLLLDNSYVIGYNPKLIIEHAVLPQKLQLKWHFKSSFEHGKTRELLSIKNRNIIHPLIELTRSIFGAIFKRFPLNSTKLLANKNYYWQNLLLDTFAPLFFYMGGVYHYLKAQ